MTATIVRMVKIGATLAKARTAQGKTIADAAAETKIRRDYLQALEEERFEVIGGEAWVRGFIRAYGRWLGLDTALLVRAYDTQHRTSHSPTAIPGAHGGELPLREKIRRSMPFVIGFGLVLIVVGVFWSRGSNALNQATEAIAPAPVEANQQSVQSVPTDGQSGQAGQGAAGQGQAGQDAPSGQPAGEPMDAPNLLIKATRNVNLIVLDGEPSVKVTMRPNEIREVSGEDVVHLSVSDAGAVRIQVNGEPLPALGGDNVGVELICERGKVACEARDMH